MLRIVKLHFNISNKEEKIMKKILISLLLTVVFAVPAFSQMKDMSMKEHGEGQGKMMQMGNMDKMGDMMSMCMAHADKMGLTDDQMMKMKPIHREMQKKQARFKADLKIAQIDLMEIMEVKNFDLEKAGAAVKKIGDIKTAHHLEMLKAMKEMHAILTDEQFKKMKKMMMSMNMKMCEKKPAQKMMMKP
jgi:Spy/CpxP family protein refolding chaperone